MTTNTLPVRGRKAATYDQLNYDQQNAAYQDGQQQGGSNADNSGELYPRQPDSQYDGFSSSEGAYVGAFGLF